MPLSLDDKLVIATSSSALFDTSESHDVFQKEGTDAYKRHQRECETVPFPKGAAYAFIERLLSLNDPAAGFQPVEVVLLSRNSAESGLRTMNSIAHYGLNITRAFFSGGRPPFRYSKAIKAVLYLSTNKRDVVEAVAAGIPGGIIMGTHTEQNVTNDELRIAFDFDGILADDSAERVYQAQGLAAYQQHEQEHKDEPLRPGPLFQLLQKIAAIQQAERRKKREDSDYRIRIRTAICTARNAPAHSRAINTLQKWGVEIDEIFFLGGIDKADVLREFQPHIFFDDQEAWATSAAGIAASVHVPFGVVNETLDQKFNGND